MQHQHQVQHTQVALSAQQTHPNPNTNQNGSSSATMMQANPAVGAQFLFNNANHLNNLSTSSEFGSGAAQLIPGTSLTHSGIVCFIY